MAIAFEGGLASALPLPTTAQINKIVASSPGIVMSEQFSNMFYAIYPSNWYKTFPYLFEIRAEGQPFYRFYLPIPPQSMTVQNISTAEAHATIGGVVEETSAPVFYTITLVGTTGLSSSGLKLSGSPNDTLAPTFRKYIDDTTGRDNPLKKLIGGAVDTILNAVSLDQEQRLQYHENPSAVNTVAGNEKVDSMIGQGTADQERGAMEKVFNKFVNPYPQDNTNLPNPFVNGWSWSHALRQMFLIYQRVRGEDKRFELYFIDARANTEYRCVPRSVQFQENAANPYISFYNIVLKCWELKSAAGEADDFAAIDRFGPNGDLKEVYTASATGLVSKLGNTLKAFSRPQNIAGSLVKTSVGTFI